MTAAERQAARERCDKVAPGPWIDDATFGPCSVSPSGSIKPVTFGGEWGEGYKEFVIAARTDLPAALDALDEVDRVADFLRRSLDENERLLDEADKRIAKLEFQNAELDFGAGGVLARLASRDRRIVEMEESVQIGKDNCATLIGFMDGKDALLGKAEERIAELEALVGEDKLNLFSRLKNEQAQAANRTTAGCRSCREKITEMEADKARLDFMILQSDMGNGWLDDGVWDKTPYGLPDVDTRDLIRMAIDAAIKDAR